MKSSAYGAVGDTERVAATATDPRTVVLAMAGREPVGFLAEIEQFRVEPDQVARVVIEEASGTIVMGSNVRVSTVAIAQGNLTIRITETPQVSQPNALAGGQTTTTSQSDIQITQSGGALMNLKAGVNLAAVVKAINALGANPQDLVSILQAMKAAGALRAELEVI